jgi:signal transduction histidine kinase
VTMCFSQTSPDLVAVAGLGAVVALTAAILYLWRRGERERRQLLELNEELAVRAQFVENQSGKPFIVIDSRGLIRRVNSIAEDVFGYREAELYGCNMLQLMPKSPAGRGGLAEICCKDGARLPIRFTWSRLELGDHYEMYLFFEKPSAAPAVNEDFDPALIAEAPPAVAAVEGVVNRIVRQFEGILTTINGYTELVMQQTSEDSPIREDLEELAAASDTASNLARNLLAFTGNQAIPVEPVDLNTLVRKMELCIRDAVHGSVQVELAQDHPVVLANADCLRQIVLLLSRSAHHRTHGVGNFKIRVQRSRLAEPRAVYTGKVPTGVFCILTVFDSGPALPPATLAQLFEPLFLDDETIGLELAPIYGIVRSLGGWIDVTSEEGLGTIFEVLLPYAGDAQVGSSAASRMIRLPSESSVR